MALESLQPTASSTHTAEKGKFSYTLVVQVPLPVLFISFDLIGDFVMPLLDKTKIPKAVRWLELNALKQFQKMVDQMTKLIEAIPEASVIIQVRVGPVTVLNIQLIAEPTPVDITLPKFVLDLPNLAVGLGITLPIPSLPPVIIRVPIPVPRIGPLRLPTVTGGEVSASAAIEPVPIASPVRLPVI